MEILNNEFLHKQLKQNDVVVSSEVDEDLIYKNKFYTLNLFILNVLKREKYKQKMSIENGFCSYKTPLKGYLKIGNTKKLEEKNDMKNALYGIVAILIIIFFLAIYFKA